MSERRNLVMSECGDAMSGRSRLDVLRTVRGVLEGLPGMLLSGEVILFPLLLGHTMGMRGIALQFGGSLVALEV